MGVLLSICLVFVYWNTMLLARIVGTPGPDAAAPLVSPVVAAHDRELEPHGLAWYQDRAAGHLGGQRQPHELERRGREIRECCVGADLPPDV